MVLFVVICCVQPVPAGAGILNLAEPDEFDDDDTYLDATIFHLIIEGDSSQVATDLGILPQRHNFHDAGDEDWIKFHATAEGLHKGWYSIRVSNLESNCDAVVELYDTDGVTLLQSRDDNLAGQDELLEWQFETDGTYYVRIKHYDPLAGGQDTGYDLAVYWPIGTSASVGVVTGTVTDQDSGTKIGNAAIRTDSGGSALVDQGHYMMLHPAGNFSLALYAEGYLSASAFVSVSSGEAVTRDFSMTAVGSTPSDNDTTCFAEDLFGADSREVEVLQDFRDHVLTKIPAGQALIRCYYRLSPVAVRLMCRNEAVKNAATTMVDRLVVIVSSGR